MKIINKSTWKTWAIEEITSPILKDSKIKDFYLICEDVFSCNGIALTNLDKPTIIIFIKDLEQFKTTFIHELTHIQQHSKGYANEEEAEERELVIT